MDPSGDPQAHYEFVTEAWRVLLGDEFHQGYFATGRESLEEATRALVLRLMDAADLRPDSEVLDVGCGTGGPACLLARLAGCRVTGISDSEAGLRRARERARELGLANRLRFECREATESGLPSASFDHVWMMEVAHLIPAKDRLLREAYRVLRPDGRLVFCDILRRRDLPIGEVLRRAKEFGVIQRVFGRAKLESLEYYERTARESGFRIISLEQIGAAIRPTFARWRENARRRAAEVEPLVGRTYLEEFLRACEVFERFWDDASLGYGVLLARK